MLSPAKPSEPRTSSVNRCKMVFGKKCLKRSLTRILREFIPSPIKCIPNQEQICKSMNKQRSYFVTEALFGEQSLWRVVRGEIDPRGNEVRTFICSCSTQRGALSMAQAISSYTNCKNYNIRVRERTLPLTAGSVS